jgi:hypothetical protein
MPSFMHVLPFIIPALEKLVAAVIDSSSCYLAYPLMKGRFLCEDVLPWNGAEVRCTTAPCDTNANCIIHNQALVRFTS